MLLVIDDALQINLVCGDEILKNTKQENVLGVTLEIKNGNKKFNALTRVQNYMATKQKSLYFPPLLNHNLPIARRYG